MKTKITKHLKKAGLLCILFAVFPFAGNAQRTVNATGGSANIGGDLYAYSIGEMVLVSTETSGTLVVTQGVLQAEGTNLGIEEATLLEESLKLYPNPVANTLYLQTNLPGSGELTLKLFDLRGRLIMQQKADLHSGTERQQMDLSSLQEGAYLLQAILQQGGRSYDHSFKILKQGGY